MSRIQACFSQLQAEGKQALIPYITAGDPDKDITLGVMHALVAHGADIIELGFPFSDPSSDGPVIQRAVERALAGKTTLLDTLAIVKRFRESNSTTPVVLMGYLNPIEYMGYQTFADKSQAAGVDGVLIVDLPPEEAHDLHPILQKSALDTIFLVAPTTTESRAEAICKKSSGYVYYVSLKGVTGAANLDIESVKTNLSRLRKHTSLPMGVGFGIRDAESAAAISQIADAVVVGSALVSRVAELESGKHYTEQELQQQISIIADMRAAMNAAN